MIEEARAYVGTDWTCGRVQLELLKREGMTPASNVLELGCGCLSAGVPILQYLGTGKYCGIEPNQWLVNAALEDPNALALFQQKKAAVLFRDDFDASETGMQFDYVLAHSVLSHCAFWQVSLFIANAAKVLAPKGAIVASFRAAEPNVWGNPGTPDGGDSSHAIWQYPGVAFYRLETMTTIAFEQGLIAMLKPRYTQILTATVPKDFHDWLVLRRPRLL